MTGRSREGHWLFFVKTEDRPGAAAAIAMIFSGRGIQIESFIGYGDPVYSAGRSEGNIVITFSTFAHRMELVRRILQRLEVVHSVDSHDYVNDPSLVKTATVCLSQRGGSIHELLRTFNLRTACAEVTGERTVAILSGRPVEVDRAVTVLSEKGCLLSAAYSFLPPGAEGGSI